MSEGLISTIIGVCGTLLGTLLGWMLQYLPNRRLSFFPPSITIYPHRDDSCICTSYFHLDIYNGSNFIKSIRLLKLLLIMNNAESKEITVQYAKASKNAIEREENEAYLEPIELHMVSPHESVRLYCRIEDENFDEDIEKAYLVYKNERNRTIKKRITVNKK